MNHKLNLHVVKLLFVILSLFSIQLYAQNVTLKVGLYPYVPRIEQFQTALTAQWKAVEPNVTLEFDTSWDGGYDSPPPADLDVFVFDAIMFEHFRTNGYLEAMKAIEIDNLDDFVDYAIDGVESDGNYYAIPQLGCTNILFYKKDDAKIANAKSIEDLKLELNTCTYTSQIPPDVRGLMLDLKGGTTNATFYLDIAHSSNNIYPLPLPSAVEIDQSVIKSMKSLLTMASYENATEDPPKDYERAEWFSDNYGRALVGFTESMSAMSKTTRDNIGFKPMPLHDTNSVPMFYADVISVNAKTNNRDLAVKLANVMASAQTMIASIGANSTNEFPQYLMATRPSVFEKIGRDFPIYNDMYLMLKKSNPIMFKLSSDSRTWLDSTKNLIRSEAQSNYQCGCDQVSEALIVNNSAANGICSNTCANNGGWNGQWTNQQPAAPIGKSVCGCNSCSN